MLKSKLKSTFVILITALTCAVILSGFLPTFSNNFLYGDISMLENQTNVSYSNTFSELSTNGKNGVAWREGMVSGNGENGVVVAGAPYNDTHIYQNIFFIMPSQDPRFTPEEVGAELYDARQAVINYDDTWNVNDRWRTFFYSYHPSHRLRISSKKHVYYNYVRYTNYDTAEVGVKYTDINGTWERATFTSREDNVTITKITESSKGKKISLTLSIDDNSAMPNFGRGDERNMQYKKIVANDCSYIAEVAKYPSYDGSELKDGGYVGFTRVITIGGNKERVEGKSTRDTECLSSSPEIKIEGAKEVYLISVSKRTFNMCSYADFRNLNDYDLLNELYDYTQEVEDKYTQNGTFNYQSALFSHKELHYPLMNAVQFDLSETRSLSNEKLLNLSRKSKEVEDEFITLAYKQGRYNQICCAGTLAPRLYGLWTGEWNPGWRSIYTLDANVNLQVSGMNTGNVYDAGIGYIKFILRQIPDWEENAKMVYGMENAIQAPVNTDGDRAMMVEYDAAYPFQYWNAGASWLLLPIYEFYQCYGNVQVEYEGSVLDLESDILLPLLTKQANFWAQLVTPEYFTDVTGKARYEKGKTTLNDGEKYLIIPSYSPENHPLGYTSTITANATMDISAARDGLNMTIRMENILKQEGYEERVAKWENLLTLLPDYKLDETGALCEWAMDEYEENNEHRHVSHLYPAWPAYEAQNDLALRDACNQAVLNRNRINAGKDDTASHGWVHKALVGARLKNAETVYSTLYTLSSSKIYYTSMMTDHNTDRSYGAYCTDTGIGMVGIINESLLYSNTGEIEVLPALPKEWESGSIRGLMARTRAQVDITWTETKAIVKVTSYEAQDIKISLYGGDSHVVSFGKGESKTIVFNR